jgi:hypothetical protein
MYVFVVFLNKLGWLGNLEKINGTSDEKGNILALHEVIFLFIIFQFSSGDEHH